MKVRFHLIIAGMLLVSMTAWAGGVKVIANPSVKANSVSAAELKSLFLEEKNSLADGSHAEPVLAKAGTAHEAFLKEYLDKSDDALQRYYRSLVFTGKGAMPKTVASDAEVIAYVAKTKGAIGYISSASASDGVKLLDVK